MKLCEFFSNGRLIYLMNFYLSGPNFIVKNGYVPQDPRIWSLSTTFKVVPGYQVILKP